MLSEPRYWDTNTWLCLEGNARRKWIRPNSGGWKDSGGCNLGRQHPLLHHHCSLPWGSQGPSKEVVSEVWSPIRVMVLPIRELWLLSEVWDEDRQGSEPPNVMHWADLDHVPLVGTS